MNITDYFNVEQGTLNFSRAQASTFAKRVAGDFNPIHDVDARRFCVPGDLLFGVVLHRYGLAPVTSVTFDGMVTDDTRIELPGNAGQGLTLEDAAGKQYLQISYSEAPQNNPAFVAALTQQYVAFSGLTFPDILVTLMQRENVMINPARPLVIYRDMQVELDQLDGTALSLEPADSRLTVDGKKGLAVLKFVITSAGNEIGRGQKTMTLGGLREYDQSAIDSIVSEYMARKQSTELV